LSLCCLRSNPCPDRSPAGTERLRTGRFLCPASVEMENSVLSVKDNGASCAAFLDGFSRFLVHWDLRESMREADVEVRTRQGKVPGSEATHHLGQWPAVHCPRFQGIHSHLGHDARPNSPNYPQSNGKLERWHKSRKNECIRPGTPLSLEDAKRLIQRYVDRYNYIRLHSAIGYVTPSDMLAGDRQRYTPSGIGNWRRRGNSGRIAANRQRDR